MKNLLKRLIVTNAFAATLLLVSTAQAMETIMEVKDVESQVTMDSVRFDQKRTVPQAPRGSELPRTNLEYLQTIKSRFLDYHDQTPEEFNTAIRTIKEYLSSEYNNHVELGQLTDTEFKALVTQKLIAIVSEKLQRARRAGNHELVRVIGMYYEEWVEENLISTLDFIAKFLNQKNQTPKEFARLIVKIRDRLLDLQLETKTPGKKRASVKKSLIDLISKKFVFARDEKNQLLVHHITAHCGHFLK